MNLISTDPKVLVNGLKRRKWFYALMVFSVLWLLGDWFVHRPTKLVASYTFESLKEDIDHTDSLVTRGWRAVWSRLPVMVQQHVPGLAPARPAFEVRLTACARFPHFGEKALPYIIPKLQDQSVAMVQEAMIGVLEIGVSKDDTFETLGKVAKNKQINVGVRRVAMLTLLALHGEEDRSITLLHELDDPSDYDALDSLPFPGNRKIGSMVIPNMVSYAPGEGKALGVVSTKWSPGLYLRLLRNERTSVKLLGMYLLRYHYKANDEMRDAVQDLLEDEDETVRAEASSWIQRHQPLRSREGLISVERKKLP